MNIVKDLLQEIFPKLRDDEIDGYRESGEWECIRNAEGNLGIARLFMKINTNSTTTTKSRLYTRDEIDTILNNAQLSITADELVKKGFLNFYFASRGIGGAHVKIYRNTQGREKIRFETHFPYDGC